MRLGWKKGTSSFLSSVWSSLAFDLHGKGEEESGEVRGQEWRGKMRQFEGNRMVYQIYGISFNPYCCYLVAKLCLALLQPSDLWPASSSVHGISQARILEWVAISFSRASSWPRDQTQGIPSLAGSFFTTESPGKPLTLITTMWATLF